MSRILTLSGAGFEAARSLASSEAPHTQGLHGHSFRLTVRHPHLTLATLREAVHAASPLSITAISTKPLAIPTTRP